VLVWTALEKDTLAPRQLAGCFGTNAPKRGEQLDGCAAHHPSSLIRRKFGGLLEPLDAVHAQVVADVGEVRSEQDLVQADNISEHPQDGGRDRRAPWSQ